MAIRPRSRTRASHVVRHRPRRTRGRDGPQLGVRVVAVILAFAFAGVRAAPSGAAEPPSPCLQAPVRARIVDPFRPPSCRWCPGNRGIEYATAPGTAARAGAGGSVSFAGAVAGTRYVVIDHPSGLRTTYGRLGTIAVAVGGRVAAGAVVGTTTDRLYFGVRRGDTYLDPARYLLQLHRRPRLVPTDGGPRLPDRSAVYTCPARQGQR